MNHRYDFIYLFDVADANPNGDPDAGNLPRVDTETGQGLVTDVMLKRKIRNFVALTRNLISPYGIYVQEGAILGKAHTEAFRALNISLGAESRSEIAEPVHEELSAWSLSEGLRLETDEDGKYFLIIEGTADKAQIKTDLKESNLSSNAQAAISSLLKAAKPRPPKREETDMGKDKMCKTYFDIRAFGAVMSLKSVPNCGQVRGPVQFSFSRSIDPIVTSEHAITRCAVATERESEKQSGGNRTMGRKFTVPYALYRTHGFINPFLAEQTGFSEEDCELLFTALENAFQFDASAARPAGSMAPRALLVFRHDGTDSNGQKAQQAKLGCAPSHSLFDRLRITSFENRPAEDGKPPRGFSAYADRMEFDISGKGEWKKLNDFIEPGNTKGLGNGITLIRRI
jgi:CRISPR-associated protein Csd2